MPDYVYLAGPISGLSPDRATSWREHVKVRLAAGLIGIDPLRDDPDFTLSKSAGDAQARLDELLHSQQMISRDRWDVSRSSVLLANFGSAKYVSVGTVGELFWADAFRKLIVIVRDRGSLHDVPFLNAITPWVFEDLDQAVDKINCILGNARPAQS